MLFFKIFKQNAEETSTKFANSIQTIVNIKPASSSVFVTNIDNSFSSFHNCVEKSSQIFSKITNDLISPLENFKESLVKIYNENLGKYKELMKNYNHSQNLFENSKMNYYKTSFQSFEYKKKEQTKEIFSGSTKKAKKEEEFYTKSCALSHINEELYKYELTRYNKKLESINDDYNKLAVLIQQNEESRIFFVKSTMDKYTALLNEYNKLIEEYTNELTKLISSEVCENDIKEIKNSFNNCLVPEQENSEKKIKFPKQKFISFDELCKTNKNKLTENEFNYEMLEDNSIEKAKISDKELDEKIKEVRQEIINEKDIDSEQIADIIAIMKNPQYDNSMKKFLDAFLEILKNSSVKVGNLNNLQHLANILCYISLTQDSIFSGKFELNFKVIFISERMFYQSKENNFKVYLSALLSRNRYYRTKFFWKDILELKLANKLFDHIDRLKKVKLPEEKKASFFSKLGNALGLNNDIKTKSLIFNSRIKGLIHNYDLVELGKIPLLDKIAITEMTTIIRESIPSFANFNFPSEECLDMIAELAEQYHVPKEHINFYVTFYNVSTSTIRRTLPNEMNNSVRRSSRYRKANENDMQIRMLGYSLSYLSSKDYLNLLLINKKTYEKLSKKIYKLVLKDPKLDQKIRINIWKNILKVKELKKKYNYKELLASVENDKKLHNEIRMDVVRTYVGEENQDEIRAKILNILKVIAISNGEVRYCQGMNYIAEFILELTNDEEEAFYLFIGFFEYTEYPLIFAKDLLRLKIFFYVFKRLISLFEPELYSYFNSNSVDVHYFMPPWFITLFLSARQFNKDPNPPIVLLRILDSFLISGWKSLMKVGINALHSYESELMKLKYEDMMQYLINDMLKFDFFLDSNLQNIERCFVETKIKKRLIKNIENEFIQDAKLNENKKINS